MWAALAAIDPGFQTATDASDIGLALLVAYALRDRPRWAVARAMANAVRLYGRSIAEVGGVDGSAERYWVSGRA